MKTFGKIAALAISLIFIIGIMVLPVNAAGNPEITVSDASGNIGDEVTVIISFTSNPGINLLCMHRIALGRRKKHPFCVKVNIGGFIYNESNRNRQKNRLSCYYRYKGQKP